MSAADNGGPAFPVPGLSSLPNDTFIYPEAGMSLRDYFAGQAMVALLPLCNNDARTEGLAYPEHVAAVSYGMADAMLKARSS